MRGFGRLFFVSALALLFSGQAAAPSLAQDGRRVITTEGADYFGRDYDILKDVDLDQCTATCLADDRCPAFTLNTTSRWCVLKEAVGELRTVAGAISGKVVAEAGIDADSVEARMADLAFLPAATLDDARQ